MAKLDTTKMKSPSQFNSPWEALMDDPGFIKMFLSD